MVGSPQLDLCHRFLQVRYHNEGEWLPDRFDFEGLGRPTLIMAPSRKSVDNPDARCELPDVDSEDDVICQMSKDDWDEKDSRVLAAMATKAIITSNPFHNSMTGPQLGDAPRRYLGVVKPIVLYQMFRAWCDQNNYTQIPSWITFLRALRASKKQIAFRKSAGQHGLCDECMYYKQQLRNHLGMVERNSTMENYAAHLLRNWRDRQIDSNFHAQAGQTRAAMLAGTPLKLLQHSVMFVRSDALDQAKHKVPRCQTFTKSFSDLIRPAMHVQMCWRHFHSMEFAIADPELPKDSCSHMECLSRLFTGIFDKHKALPRHLFVALDNTSRDNKNAWILRYFIKLRILNTFESIYVCYPVKGHTHTQFWMDLEDRQW